MIQQLLLERYPEIYFHLNYSAHENFSRVCEGEISRKDLEEIEILYLCGIDRGMAYSSLKGWLKQAPHRRLIFLEDELGAFAALLQMKEAAEILADPQVELRYVQDWESAIEAVAQTYPVAHIAISALPSYKKKYRKQFSKIRLQLLRATSVFYALLSEGLFADKLLSNLAVNMRRIPQAFYANKMEGSYRDIPAIICGAGPSLESSMSALKNLENRALIIAGGSAVAATTSAGVLPHLAMAFDPNPEEFERFKGIHQSKIPFLFGSRVHPDLFSVMRGPIGYMKSDTGGAFEEWMEERLSIAGVPIGPDLGREAFSVTTMAIAFACALGCNPIIFAGIDLAFTGKKRYADGVVLENLLGKKMTEDKRAPERVLRKNDRLGRPVYTLVKWVMEAHSISAFAKSHPERIFLNATEGGLGFSGIEFMPLPQIVEKYCQKRFDLKGMIEKQTQEFAFSNLSISQIDTIYEELAKSLQRSLVLCEKIVEEVKNPSSRKIVLELDLQEEIAYKPLLELQLHACERLMFRLGVTGHEREAMKWQRAKEIIQNQLQILIPIIKNNVEFERVKAPRFIDRKRGLY